jgi:hypothetical protein
MNIDLQLGSAGLDMPGSLSGADFSLLKDIDVNPSNALYVQNSVQHQPIPFDNALFVHFAVRASQFESTIRDIRMTSFQSSIPGVSSLLDPFSFESKAFIQEAEKNAVVYERDNSKTVAAMTSVLFNHSGVVDTPAQSFVSQLEQSASTLRPIKITNIQGG